MIFKEERKTEICPGKGSGSRNLRLLLVVPTLQWGVSSISEGTITPGKSNGKHRTLPGGMTLKLDKGFPGPFKRVSSETVFVRRGDHVLG